MINGSSIEPFSEGENVDTFVYPFFGNVPNWVLVTGVTVGLVVGLVLALIGTTAAVRQYKYESYQRTSVRFVEAVSTLVFNVGFWLLLATVVGFVAALFVYLTWPYPVGVAVVLVGLGVLLHYRRRPQ